MAQVLQIPKISTNGNIKPEYLESYNHQLTESEVKELICSDESVIKLINALIASENLELFKFFFKKLSYDDKAKGLFSLNNFPKNLALRQYVLRKVNSFDDDYSKETKRFLERFRRSRGGEC